jgi:hypothetical protein
MNIPAFDSFLVRAGLSVQNRLLTPEVTPLNLIVRNSLMGL